MRKYLRRIARYRMERAGIQHINRTRKVKGQAIPSYFAQHWRETVGAVKR